MRWCMSLGASADAPAGTAARTARPIDAARFETDKAKYEAQVKSFIKSSMEQVPRIPLYQQVLDMGLQKNIKGYTYWFHRQLDFRQIEKA